MIADDAKEHEHITFMICISAEGSHLKPGAILSLVYLPEELEELLKIFTLSGQSSGWMTKEIFHSWVLTVFIPAIQWMHVLSPQLHNHWALLLVDGHSSHADYKICVALQNAGIIKFTLLAHTSYVLQHLDCGLIKRFKTNLWDLKMDCSMCGLNGPE